NDCHALSCVYTSLMLDIRLIREKPDFVRERLATRGGGDEAKIDTVLTLDRQLRAGEAKVQEFREEKNRKSQEVRELKSGGKPSLLELALETSKGLDRNIAALDQQIDELKVQRLNLLREIPNLPHASVPPGKDPSGNKPVREWGKKPELRGKVLDHVALGEKLRIL